nr:transglycosylase SLT domain-containing protein [Cochlodiniinecator piscidefendens]
MAGCSGSAEVQVTREVRADMRWDHLPQATAWTDAALNALAGHGAALENLVPADIETWCPAYEAASIEQRRLFWSGMLSTLAKHESTWNQRAVGGNGRWFGLAQIAPATARGYGCDARSGEALLNGEANLSCAVRIAAHTVVRDGVVAANGRGLAADWGPFHSTRKRNDMIEWTNAQSYCAL